MNRRASAVTALAFALAALIPFVGCSFLLSTDGLTEGGESATASGADAGADVRADVGADAGTDVGAGGNTQADVGAPPDAMYADGATPAGDSAPVDAVADDDVSGPPPAETGPGSDGNPANQDASIDSGTVRDSSGTLVNACAVADSSTCVGDLSHIGTGDFLITLHVTTTQNALTALVNQRSQCGRGMFWDVRLQGGALLVETDDDVTTPTRVLGTGPLVNDGLAHCVSVARTAGVLTLSVDGTASGTTNSVSSFAQLPGVSQAADACEGAGGAKDGTIQFVGTIANLCLATP